MNRPTTVSGPYRLTISAIRATSKPAQQDVLPGDIDPETAVLTKAPNGNYALAPQYPKSAPGITVFAPKK
jgi:hypothetical protein